MKILFKAFITTTLALCVFSTILSSSSAFAQSRNFHAQRIVLDNDSGKTFTIQVPPGMTGNQTYTFPTVPAGETPGFVDQGGASGQILYWTGTQWDSSDALTISGPKSTSNVTVNGGLTIAPLGAGVLHSSASGAITSSPLDLSNTTTEIKNMLPIANGGTNSNFDPIAGSVAYGTGTGYAFTVQGIKPDTGVYYVLVSNGSGAPYWVPASLNTNEGISTKNNSTLAWEDSVWVPNPNILLAPSGTVTFIGSTPPPPSAFQQSLKKSPGIQSFGGGSGSQQTQGTQTGSFNFLSNYNSFSVGYNLSDSVVSAFKSGKSSATIQDYSGVPGNWSFSAGYGIYAGGSASDAFGNFTYATGTSSVAMGAYVSTSGGTNTINNPGTTPYNGTFIYGDESTEATQTFAAPTANNQFIVRAAGGVIFTNTNNVTQTTGDLLDVVNNGTSVLSLDGTGTTHITTLSIGTGGLSLTGALSGSNGLTISGGSVTLPFHSAGILHNSSTGGVISSAIALGSSDVSGTLSTTNGGTGVNASLTSPNVVFAGPSLGPSSGSPTFRSLVSADIPSLAASYILNSGTALNPSFNIAGGGTIGSGLNVTGGATVTGATSITGAASSATTAVTIGDGTGATGNVVDFVPISGAKVSIDKYGHPIAGADVAGTLSGATTLTFTFANPYPHTPTVIISPNDATTATATIYLSAVSTNGFSVTSPAGTATLNINYQVIGN